MFYGIIKFSSFLFMNNGTGDDDNNDADDENKQINCTQVEENGFMKILR